MELKVEVNRKASQEIIPMRDMEPFDIGIVDEEYNRAHGNIVMRTASISKFEVIDLSNRRPDGCWLQKNEIPVRLLRRGESITLTRTV